MRRRGRYPIGMLVMAPVLGGLAAYTLASGQPLFAGEPTPAAQAQAAASVTPDGPATTATATPDGGTAPDYVATLTPEERAILYPSPSPTPAQAAVRGAFHAGALVRVNAGAGDCLNARAQPAINDQYVRSVNLCVPDGYQGIIDGTATAADGHWWWMLVGAGWVAEDYLAFVRDVAPGEALAPQLVGQGRIAFLRSPLAPDGGPGSGYELWVMNADGSGQHRLAGLSRRDKTYAYPYNLRWSPDGTRLSYTIAGAKTDVTTGLAAVDLHVVDAATGADTVIAAGAGGGEWSPDGTKIGVVHGAAEQQMGGGWQGAPGWVDVATGAVHLLTQETFYQQDPPAWNFDGTLVMISRLTSTQDGQTTQIQIVDAASGAEVARIEPAAGLWYMRPQWSPTENRIGFHITGVDVEPRYAVYGVAAGRIVAQAALPARDPNAGGRCGGGDMYLLHWSSDGKRIAYTFGDGVAGANGLWAWDIASGKQTLTAAFNAGEATTGPGGRFLYSAWAVTRPYIFATDPSGGQPGVIAEGAAPVWSPR